MLLSNYLLLPLVALVEAREVLVQRSAAAALLKWQRAAMMTPRAHRGLFFEWRWLMLNG